MRGETLKEDLVKSTELASDPKLQIVALSNSLKIREGENRALTAERDDLKFKHDKLSKDLEIKINEVDKHNSKLQECFAQIKDLESQLKAKSSQVSSTGSQIKEKNDELEKLKARYASEQITTKALKNDLNSKFI
ncbi:unnamed protein product [[Candida] boidinii]|nr:unnamed protein product [[Candida] boidinii]